jgi:hypothetical protein
MSTNTNTASAKTSILAIDLGKYKSVACVYDQASGESRFTTIDTSRVELHRLLDKAQPGVVLLEACLLAGWVHDLCAELGVRCLVANTASEAWKFKHLKRKTDKDDALRLAQLYALGQLPTVTLPPPTVRQGRSLIAVRQAWVGRRVAVQKRIRALFVAQGLPAPRGAKPWSSTGLAGFATQARKGGKKRCQDPFIVPLRLACAVGRDPATCFVAPDVLPRAWPSLRPRTAALFAHCDARPPVPPPFGPD